MSSAATSLAPLPKAISKEFIVDKIFPRSEVHLLGGPSGAGKTTLLFQILSAWELGEDVFGYKSFPLPWAYIACDRSQEATERTLKRLNLHPSSVCSLVNTEIPLSLPAILTHVQKSHTHTKVLAIDGIGRLCPEGKINDYNMVSNFLCGLNRFCRKNDVTIIGLGHTTKVKKGEEFINPRQRILGSVAWGGFSDTVVVIEPTNPEDVDDPQRTVLILPRNESSFRLDYQFDKDGKLVPRANEVAEVLFEQWLNKQSAGFEFTVLMLVEATGQHRRTVERWLAKQVENGRLTRRKPNNNPSALAIFTVRPEQ